MLSVEEYGTTPPSHAAPISASLVGKPFLALFIPAPIFPKI